MPLLQVVEDDQISSKKYLAVAWQKGVSVSSETMARLLRQMVLRDFKVA